MGDNIDQHYHTLQHGSHRFRDKNRQIGIRQTGRNCMNII